MRCQTLPHSCRSQFPNLTNKNHSIKSPRSDDYNCLAWAYGVNDKWMWPGDPDSYWPSEVTDVDILETATQLFLESGFNKCETSELEEGYIKIAIYVKEETLTHAAFQLDSGRWSSKLGSWEDIEHDTLRVLESESYGKATIFLKKRRN